MCIHVTADKWITEFIIATQSSEWSCEGETNDRLKMLINNHLNILIN